MAVKRTRTQDQDAKDYPDLSEDKLAAPTTEPEKAPKQQKFNPKKAFSMVWHAGFKQYLQDGVIYDRGSKLPIANL